MIDAFDKPEIFEVMKPERPEPDHSENRQRRVEKSPPRQF
jgi:hypothetical protein